MVDGIHHKAIAVGVFQPLVDPGGIGEARFIDFASGEHDLLRFTVEFVTVDVDVGELVVGAKLL